MTPELAHRVMIMFNEFYTDVESQVAEYPPSMHDAILESMAHNRAECAEAASLRIDAKQLKEFYRKVN